MKYDISWLQNQMQITARIKYIFFWGHQPSRNGSVTKTCLSQWWEQDFEVDGTLYRSAEHWMMAEKARLFGDEQTLRKILAAYSPAEVKKLGREVRNFDEHTWQQHRYDIVTTGSIHKFGQNEDLKTYLLQTDDRVLVEASPYDRIWGIGKHANDSGIEHPDNWDGLNLLGFALMEARDALQ